MKVKALASLSTANGWKSAGEEFTVSAADAEELVGRGLVERSVAEPVAVAEPASKPAKPTKPKA
ncbi:hypothetical protein [Pseudomonas petrae]|uniref:Mu-like prophage FluMu N-terminal domain-containing protein n=1 Tax=Pseudomonas petrae TaxID=2912190 RepID=A0ABS9ICV5_9PSED|nr:hypothetical protein [Pseudomonas petrae]MCF7545555.1 hypothetical protein [Pseudomonas petrae]